jgi:site-specific DNA-methyltransferase (adenine-specific)
LNAVLSFLESNQIQYKKPHTDGKAASYHTNSFCSSDVNASLVRSIQNGMNEKSIIRTDRRESDTFTKHGVNADHRKSGDRSADVMQSIGFGMNEKTIIKQVRDHYATIHPTQKPCRLLERLLALVGKPGDLVLDPFSGSAQTAISAYNTGFPFICFEIEKEYYDKSIEWVSKVINVPKQQKLFTA